LGAPKLLLDLTIKWKETHRSIFTFIVKHCSVLY
jgi:hypothetical protein